MDYQMSFARLINYDPGLPGITVDVTIGLVGVSLACAAKLDTGSTNCVFERRHGESLGLDIESGERVRTGTPTGSFIAYRHTVTMTGLDYAFDAGVCFPADEYINRNVLGRLGFLDRFRLGLIDYDGKLYCSRYDE
ncbi:MAG: hypothetical protein HYR56_12960 [Acidobacteria bacterium]|nr:hypothetical protein [Acidobacteriota bacterium]MBI3426956.1 hypothetical protein [Acidobacteriota bacterium]